MINTDVEVSIPMYEYLELLRIQARYDELREHVYYLKEHTRQTTHEALCDIKEGGVDNG